MKQLMDHFGPYVILALNDRVLVLIQKTDSNNENAHTVIHELQRPLSTSKEDLNKKSANPKKKKKTSNDEGKDQNSENTKNANQVQAVSLIVYENHLICAVSRFNKSLSLYCISLSKKSASITDAQTPKSMTEKVEAYLTYNLNKRCCSLAFTDLPTKSSSTKNTPIIVTADLTGDAFAYPIHFVDSSQPNNDNTMSTSNSKSHKKRLLLGHTASMITSVKIVKNMTYSSSEQKQQQQRILTADRDEKIRISFFPQTFLIEHYLLGHTAFISCMDVSRNMNISKCVTGSGDGTVRVWDYCLNKELYQVSPLSKNVEKCSSIASPSTEEKGNEDSTSSKRLEQQQQQQQQQPSLQSCTNANLNHCVPSNVAMSRDGRMIAIAWDLSLTVKILLFSDNRQNSESNSIEVTHTYNIQCPKQPLSLCFFFNENKSKESLLILTSDTQNVLLQYTPDTDVSSSETEVTLSSSSSPSNQSLLLQTLQTYITQTNDIEMPLTVMEYKNENQTNNNNKSSLKMIKGSDPVGFPSTTKEEETVHNKESSTGGGLIKKDSQNNQQPKWNNSIERKEKHRLKQAQRRKRKRNTKVAIHSDFNDDSDKDDENTNHDDN